MPDYSNSKVYKIWSPSHPGEIYIGSTTQSLAKRMVGHRAKYKSHQNGKFPYITSFKIMEYGDARIELIEKCSCSCREELVAREGYYIRTLDCVNKNIPDRTNKQYYEDNKEKRLNYHKQWYQDNRDKRLEQMKQYHEANRTRLTEKVKCNCGSVITRHSLPRHKRSKKHMKYLESIKS